MTKQELIKEVCKVTGADKNVTGIVINETFEIMKQSLCKGESIYIRGLFTLSPKKRAAKTAQNISKKISIALPAHFTPHAKFAKEVRNKMMILPIK